MPSCGLSLNHEVLAKPFQLLEAFGCIEIMHCVTSMFHEKICCHIIMCSLNECSRTMDILNSYCFETFYL
jgi:hypothetical protein